MTKYKNKKWQKWYMKKNVNDNMTKIINDEKKKLQKWQMTNDENVK